MYILIHKFEQEEVEKTRGFISVYIKRIPINSVNRSKRRIQEKNKQKKR